MEVKVEVKMDNTFVYNIKLNNMELKRKLKWKLNRTNAWSSTVLSHLTPLFTPLFTSFFTPHFTPTFTPNF